MSTTDIKNRNTLCRFVSLRSPELSKAANKNHRFVFHPQNEAELNETSGNFFTAVKNKPANQTKKEALTVFSADFTSAFTSEKDLKNIDEAFFEAANWLALNKTKVSEEEIFNKISSVTNLSETAILEIWDNLFYQTTTHKTFYEKKTVCKC